MRTLFLGVDPGLNGALALFDRGQPGGKLIDVIDVPTVETKQKNNRRIVDLPRLALWVDSHAAGIKYAIIEDVGVMTGREGVVGMFRFGQAAGGIAGVIAGCSIPSIFVKPAIWKTLCGLSSDKNLSRTVATKLFPKSSHLWARKKDDGRAEAAVLAHFGAERFP